jgi:hypothetical protein
VEKSEISGVRQYIWKAEKKLEGISKQSWEIFHPSGRVILSLFANQAEQFFSHFLRSALQTPHDDCCHQMLWPGKNRLAAKQQARIV